MLRAFASHLTNSILKPLLSIKPNSGLLTSGAAHKSSTCTSLTPFGLKSAFTTPLVTLVSQLHCSPVEFDKSLLRMHRTGPIFKKRPKKRLLDGRPQMRGVVIRTLIKKPKKPNSANRKCVLLRLSNGKESVAYVPGIGHNLQEHNVVLVECSRLQDVPGVKFKVIRGKYDCAHVIKPTK